MINLILMVLWVSLCSACGIMLAVHGAETQAAAIGGLFFGTVISFVVGSFIFLVSLFGRLGGGRDVKGGSSSRAFDNIVINSDSISGD